MSLVLLPPDCRAYADPFYLTPEQRRELILLIAEMGEAGIDEYLKRHAKGDNALARRINRLRSKLIEEAAELRRRLHTQYDESRDRERQRTKEVLERLHREQDEIDKHQKAWSADLPLQMERRLRELPLLDLAIRLEELPWYSRLWNGIRRFVAAIWRGILSLFGRAPKPVGGKARGIAVGVPGLAGPGVVVELDLETALKQNPRLRKRIRQGMGETWGLRARRMWRILWGAEDYAEVARQIMEEEARRSLSQQTTAATQEQERLERERREKELAAEKLAKESEIELERLDRAEKLELDRLEHSLAAQPAQDARDVLVGELEAGGLLQKLEDGRVEVTHRFLEGLAQIVYAEEAKGMGSTHESPMGATIEGDGILDRTPLLSHDETSHMDTVASLLNARTRHPHVRHLLEEDVLVYRERRSSRTQVVLILDKSLSMEENNRLDAGKRAVLSLFWATKRRSPQNEVDILLMDTSVQRVDLGQAWAAKPGGFTNTGRAIEAARALLERSRASRKLLFVVTDGLPEALTVEGKDVAGRPEEALAYAVRQAERLRQIKGLATTIVLLEPKDPLFVKAGETLAKRANGKLVKVEPKELARTLLVEMRSSQLEANAA